MRASGLTTWHTASSFRSDYAPADMSDTMQTVNLYPVSWPFKHLSKALEAATVRHTNTAPG